MKTANPQKLICSCCGNHTKGRQWWNQDTGYGLCPKCATWIESRSPCNDVAYMKLTYGEKGVHYGI